MARHAKKQKKLTTKQTQRKQATRKTRFALPKIILLIIGLGIIVYLGVILISDMKAESKMLKQCGEIQQYGVSEEVCRKALFCARDKIGYKTLLKYDEGKIEGYENTHITKIITGCTLQAMIEEIED